MFSSPLMASLLNTSEKYLTVPDINNRLLDQVIFHSYTTGVYFNLTSLRSDINLILTKNSLLVGHQLHIVLNMMKMHD